MGPDEDLLQMDTEPREAEPVPKRRSMTASPKWPPACPNPKEAGKKAAKPEPTDTAERLAARLGECVKTFI